MLGKDHIGSHKQTHTQIGTNKLSKVTKQNKGKKLTIQIQSNPAQHYGPY